MVAIYIVAAFFGLLTYISKRRVGLPSLGLIAGSIIGLNWASYVTVMLQAQGIRLLAPSLDVVVGIGLVLIPGLLLLIIGPKYHKKIARAVSALLVMALALAFIVAVLSRQTPGFVADNSLLLTIHRLQPFIIVLVVIVALADVVHTHLPKKRKHTAQH